MGLRVKVVRGKGWYAHMTGQDIYVEEVENYYRYTGVDQYEKRGLIPKADCIPLLETEVNHEVKGGGVK